MIWLNLLTQHSVPHCGQISFASVSWCNEPRDRAAAHIPLLIDLLRQDDGNRRFVMVQLPEPMPEDSPARKVGFKTVADIGKERIRCVIANMQQADEGQLPLLDTRETPEDLGFKVFKLAPSNYHPWPGVDDDMPTAYAQQMALFADPLVDAWTAENVIYEVALKEGYGLNCRIDAVDGEEATVYRVMNPDKEQSFLICLDEALHPKTVQALDLTKEGLFVCRDIALTDDLAANLALQCRLKTI